MSAKTTHMAATTMLFVTILKAALCARVNTDTEGTEATAQVSRYFKIDLGGLNDS